MLFSEAASQQTDERAGGAAPAVGPPILEVQDLSTSFFTSHGEFCAADRISFVVHRGEILGVVGESGSGKTVTALSLLRLVDPPGRIVGGSVRLEGEELLSKSEREMQALRGRGMSILLVTHDLGVVAETCHRVLVMYAGRIVESAGTVALFDAPSHPYTQSLLQSVPRRDTRRGDLVSIPGRVPELNAIPKGCPFHPRCPSVMRVCREREPPLATVAPGHVSRCHLHG